jgi:hypothetical protein
MGPLRVRYAAAFAAVLLWIGTAQADGLAKVGSRTLIVDQQPRWPTVARQSAMPLPLASGLFIVPSVSNPLIDGSPNQQVNFQSVNSSYGKQGDPVVIFEASGTSCCGNLAENGGAKFADRTHVVVPIFTVDRGYEIFGFPVFPDGTASFIGERYTRNKDGHQNGPVVVPIRGSKAFAMWGDFFHETGESDASVRGAMISSDGVPTGPDILLEFRNKGYQLPVDGVQLADKRLLLVWKVMYKSDPVKGARFLGRLMRKDGSLRGKPFEVGATNINFFFAELRVTALPDGNFVATWVDDRSGAPQAVYQLFTGTGTPLGEVKLLGAATDTSPIRPDVAALADGRFVITGTLACADGTSRFIAQLAAADGEKLGDPVVLQALANPDVVQEHYSANAATLLNTGVTPDLSRDVYVTWRIDQGKNYNLFGQAVRATP